MADTIQRLADLLFMPYVVGVLLLTGLFLTIRLGVVQLRRLPEAFRAMLGAPSTGKAAGVCRRSRRS